MRNSTRIGTSNTWLHLADRGGNAVAQLRQRFWAASALIFDHPDGRPELLNPGEPTTFSVVVRGEYGGISVNAKESRTSLLIRGLNVPSLAITAVGAFLSRKVGIGGWSHDAR